jgi:hypothetical protein
MLINVLSNLPQSCIIAAALVRKSLEADTASPHICAGPMKARGVTQAGVTDCFCIPGIIYRIFDQGKRILISHVYETGKNLEEVVLVPTSQETFAFDAPLAGFLLF